MVTQLVCINLCVDIYIFDCSYYAKLLYCNSKYIIHSSALVHCVVTIVYIYFLFNLHTLLLYYNS